MKTGKMKLSDKKPSNKYIIEFIGQTGNLDSIKILSTIFSKKVKNDIIESISFITEFHYDEYGMTNEEPVLKMLEENKDSPLYSKILESIEHNRRLVKDGILHQKKS
jgi:hypothetical protein